MVGLVVLILGIGILLKFGVAVDVQTMLIRSIPGTLKIERIVDAKELIKSNVICLIVLGAVIAGVSLLGYVGTCFKVKLMLYLVSKPPCTCVMYDVRCCCRRRCCCCCIG